MGENAKGLTDLELLLHLGHDAITSIYKQEVRRRYPKGSQAYQSVFSVKSEEEDPGHIYVANHSFLKGKYAFVQKGKSTLAKLHPKEWEAYKAAHPDWRNYGEEE